MRQQLIYIVCVLCPFLAAGENLISQCIIMGDDMGTDTTHTFVYNNFPITLNLVDAEDTGRWEFKLLCPEGYILQKEGIAQKGKTSFVIGPSQVIWRSGKPIMDNDSNLIYRSKIVFTTHQQERDSIFLKFRLIPTKPKVKNVSFSYVYDWEYDDIYPNGDITFDVESSNATRLELDMSDPFYFEVPPKETFIFTYTASFDVNKFDTLHSISTWSDWGIVYRFIARNDYGSIYGTDTIFSTDYITDPEILERINELKENSDIKETYATDNHIYYDGHNNVHMPETYNFLSVIDILGKKYDVPSTKTSIDVGNLPKGFYIIIYKTDKNKLHTLKIRKT